MPWGKSCMIPMTTLYVTESRHWEDILHSLIPVSLLQMLKDEGSPVCTMDHKKGHKRSRLHWR